MAAFESLFPHILESEGIVFENDSADTAGATKFGIITDDLKTYYHDQTKTWQDVKNLTQDEAFKIYKKLYWDAFKADEIKNDSLAHFIVDGAINQGKGTITKYIQQVCGITADGIFGSGTLAAVNAHNPKELFEGLKQKRLDKYHRIVENNPSQQRFIKGWIRRLNSITYKD
jgi:lysozyme family protein